VPWLAREVDRQLGKAVVVAFPSVGHADAPYQVRGTIHNGIRMPVALRARRAVGVRHEQ